MARVAIALGSNLGDREALIRRAVDRLCEKGLRPLALSSLYWTAPVDCRAGAPAFLNAAWTATTEKQIREVFSLCRQVEDELGRVRHGNAAGGYEDRLIDLDLLLYDDCCLNTADLTIPHPRMVERQFVLQPLAEIAGDWRIPGLGLTVESCWRRLQNKETRDGIRTGN